MSFLRNLLFFRKKKSRIAKSNSFSISKRQKFIIAVLVLSLGIFFSEHFFGKSGVYMTLFLAFLSSLFFYLAMRKDIAGNFQPQIFILPSLFTISFGLFYFLVPSRILTRTFMSTLYAVGLYSLYLSLNIFIVASIRTIALLSGARIVSFVITLVSYFFLANITFALHFPVFITAGLIFLFSFLLILQALWTITLERSITNIILWVFIIAVCLFEVAVMLWFWPSTPTVIALFLTGLFYTLVGLSQVWFDKRLFRGVIWEYMWVAVIVFCVLIIFTSWKG